MQAYLEPIVHEIKVSRADLLCDLKRQDKRDTYLDVTGRCRYVLGSDAGGRTIAEPDEVSSECGVMVLVEDKLVPARDAPKRASEQLPLAVWMALAKATQLSALSSVDDQAPLD